MTRRDELISRQDAIDALSSENPTEIYIYYDDAVKAIRQLPSAEPDTPMRGSKSAETAGNITDRTTGDCISRQAAIDALEKVAEMYPWRVPGDSDSYSSYNEAWQDALNRAENEIEALPSAEPDNRLAKIADLVEGTIDHFDLDDAMDLLYQIKDVLK